MSIPGLVRLQSQIVKMLKRTYLLYSRHQRHAAVRGEINRQLNS